MYERSQKSDGTTKLGRPKKKDKPVEKQQNVETEDEGRVSGEESQDEGTSKATKKPEPVPVNVEDEDTRAESIENESITTSEISTAVQNPEGENSSSSSSEDRPILSRLEMAGTKRKAEVLSKSGKIGVTITTSGPTSSSPPPSKLSKLVPVKQSSTSVQHNRTNGRQSTANEEETSAIPSASSPAALTATAPRTSTDKRPSPIDATLPHASTKEPESPKPVASRTDEKRSESKQMETKGDTAHLRVRNGRNDSSDSVSANATYNNKPLTVNGHHTVSFSDDISSAVTSPGSDYWLARNPVADQVFITDVTVNLKTVTIRECKTEKGFFKERDDTDKLSKSKDVL